MHLLIEGLLFWENLGRRERSKAGKGKEVVGKLQVNYRLDMVHTHRNSEA